MTSHPLPIQSPSGPAGGTFTDAAAAVAELERLYQEATQFLQTAFAEALAHGAPAHRYRAFYPEVRLISRSFGLSDSRLSFGHVAEPGIYAATITRPDLFQNYLT